jgi:hypothetical protein
MTATRSLSRPEAAATRPVPQLGDGPEISTADEAARQRGALPDVQIPLGRREGALLKETPLLSFRGPRGRLAERRRYAVPRVRVRSAAR